MTVIAFIGKPRTGKTLGMTIFAYDYYFNKFHEIYSNYKLTFAKKTLDVYDMLEIPFNDVDRQPKTLCIQEADKIFDSRRSMKEENRLLSSLTGQSGKRNLNIFYDTQFFERVDRGLRRVTEYIVECSCYVNSYNQDALAFEYIINDMFDNKERKLVFTINDRINQQTIKDYFKMYDSYETTEPLMAYKKEGDK